MTPTIRLARDEDGPAIGKLFAEADYFDQGVDWTRPGVGGWWLVAERKPGVLVGAVQIAAAKPFGYIGEIVVHPSAQARREDGEGALGKDFGALAMTLYVWAVNLLERGGSQLAMGVVSDAMPAHKTILERHGAVNLGRFDLMARRLS